MTVLLGCGLLVGGALASCWLQWAFRRGHLLRSAAALLAVLLCAVALVGLTLARPAAAAGGCSPGAPALADVEIAKLLQANGFGDPVQLREGIAIVLAESGGNPLNCNPSGARGLWQFMPNTLADDACAFDPACSTRAAKATRDRRGWQPWSTWTGGQYRAYLGRADAAIKAAGIRTCDPVMDVACAMQPVHVGLPQVNVGTPLSGLPELPSIDWGRLASAAAVGLLYTIDLGLKSIVEKLWAGMVVGEDDLGGGARAGRFLIVDNSGLHRIWLFMFSLVFSSHILVLALTVFSLLLLFGGNAGHELKRFLLRFVASLLLMLGSWTAMTSLIAVDNALVGALGSHVSLELRDLPAWQGLNLQDPGSLGNEPALIGEALALEALILVLVLLLVVLMVLLVVRLVLIWLQTAISPWVAAAFPYAPGLAVGFARTAVGWIFLKAALLVTVMVFVLMGVYAPWSFVNVLVMIAAVIAFILFPAIFLSLVAKPWEVEVGNAATMAVLTWHVSPIRMAGGLLRDRVGGDSLADARLKAQTRLANARADRQQAEAEWRRRRTAQQQPPPAPPRAP